jgi:predicted outer membrane repeat protein
MAAPTATTPLNSYSHSALHSNLRFDVKTFGAIGNGVADDTAAIQNTIFAQQVSGGTVFIPAGTYNITNILVPAPAITAGTVATHACKMVGVGGRDTILKRVTSSGTILGVGRSGQNPTIGKWIVEDIGFDGNYSGVGGGALAASAGTQLITSQHPFTSASATTAPAGLYNEFSRCRFYRPTGYAFQPCRSVRLVACEFDSCGQPDIVGTHYDNLGSGDWSAAIVIGCQWHDSMGNFADFVEPTSGKPGHLTMIGCRSYNHDIGGVYAAGIGSVIMGNQLQNNTAASAGVGYDAATHVDNRQGNIVAFNTLTNMLVTASGLSLATRGDVVLYNQAYDSSASAIPYAKAGAISDVDFTVTPSNLTMALDTSNLRLYIRTGGAWHYAALT